MHGTSSASSMILATVLGHLVPSSPANASIAQGGSGRALGSGDSTRPDLPDGRPPPVGLGSSQRRHVAA